MNNQTTHIGPHLLNRLTKHLLIPGGIIPILFSLFILTMHYSHSMAEESCTQLLKTRCESCHYLTRVCQKLEKNQDKSFFGNVFAGSWSRSIKNMVRQGAKLTEAEQKKLTKCLDNSDPEVLELCNLKK